MVVVHVLVFVRCSWWQRHTRGDEGGLLRGELGFISRLFPCCSPVIAEMLCLPRRNVTSPRGICAYAPFLPTFPWTKRPSLSSHRLYKQSHTPTGELLALLLTLTTLNACLVPLLPTLSPCPALLLPGDSPGHMPGCRTSSHCMYYF